MAPEDKQSPNSLYWVCAGVTLLIGAFQYTRSFEKAEGLDALAVLGLVVLTLLLLALAGLFALCALQRTDLHQRLYGGLDVFRVATILFVAAVLIGVLIPPRSTATLGLLLPFGLSYWLYHLKVEEMPED